MNVGIVGAGLIGQKRATALKEFEDTLCCVAEVDVTRLTAFVNKFGCEGFQSWEEMLDRNNVEAMVVATPNK